MGMLGLLAVRTGDSEGVERFEQRLAASDSAIAFAYRAAIAARLGEAENALQWLKVALNRGVGPGRLAFLEMEFESIKDHATYRELMSPEG